MRYLLDTNILVRLSDAIDPLHAVATAAVAALEGRCDVPCVTPQNVIEFWSVVTRPRLKRGLGQSAAEADFLAVSVERRFLMLPDTDQVYPLWRSLVRKHALTGVVVHDARLAAVCIAHAVDRVLTFNMRDFLRYNADGVTAVDPHTV